MSDPLRTPVAAALAAAAAWIALLSWRGLAEDPGRITRPLLVGAVIVAVVGWAVRRWTGRAWLAAALQLLVLLVWSLHRTVGTWVPRPGAIHELVELVGNGIVASQRYYSPVPTQYSSFSVMVTLAGLGVIVLVDLCACGLRQPALAALPLLLAITVSASVLISPINLAVFVGATVCWLALLVLRDAARWHAWRPQALVPTATVTAIGAVGVAVLLSSGVGTQGRLFQNGPGTGDGPGDSLNLDNPLLDMRRNLRASQDVPLLDVQPLEQGQVPAYVRMTVLDGFNGAAWYPTPRDPHDTRPVQGALPYPVGLPRSAGGRTSAWILTTLPALHTNWLPLPVPTQRLDVGPEWRYDPQTLDVSSHTRAATDMRYRADTFPVTIDPAALRSAGEPPKSIADTETTLPRLPIVFREVAQRVVAGATNDWDRAVLLQDWFRSAGGFRYDTDPAPGNGINTLQRFITTDRVGYCEQFATAMATLARVLGIPARVAVGFLHSTESTKGTFTFSAQDLHAWPELYFAGAGWVRFEPTPGIRTGDAPAYTQSQVVRSTGPSDSPTPTAQPSSAQPSRASASPSPKARHGSATGSVPTWPFALAALLVLVGAIAATPFLLRRSRARQRWARARDPRALADAAWEEVRETSLDLGLGWSDTASVRVNGRQAQEAVAEPHARDALGEVVRFVELTRYAGGGSETYPSSDVRADVDRWRAAAYDEADPRIARRARWWPRRRGAGS